MNLLSVKLWSRRKIHAGFTVTPQTANVMAILRDKCLVKMEKALNCGIWCYLQFHSSTGSLECGHGSGRVTCGAVEPISVLPCDCWDSSWKTGALPTRVVVFQVWAALAESPNSSMRHKGLHF